MTSRKLRVPVPSSSVNANNDDVDMSAYQDLTSNDSSSNSSSGDASGLGFLGNIAQASGASESSVSSETGLSSSSGLNTNPISKLSRDSPQHLKVKLEDVEYKVTALKSRMDKILDRLDLAEKKIERWDRR